LTLGDGVFVSFLAKLFRKILAGQVKDRPGSDEPGLVYFMGFVSFRRD
jgi:hypothetical protein